MILQNQRRRQREMFDAMHPVAGSICERRGDEWSDCQAWCTDNNLLLNTIQTKEIVVDFRKRKTDIKQLYIRGDCVERVSDFHFLGFHIMEDLSWGVNTVELAKKAQQRLYFLRVLGKNNIPQKLLESFYRCSVEIILC